MWLYNCHHSLSCSSFPSVFPCVAFLCLLLITVIYAWKLKPFGTGIKCLVSCAGDQHLSESCVRKFNKWLSYIYIYQVFTCKCVQYIYIIKVKESRKRPGVAQMVPGGLGSQISWHSAHEGCEVVSLTHRPPLPPGMFLVLIFTRGWVNPRAMVRSEGKYVTEKSSDTAGNPSRDGPTSGAAP